MNNIRRKRRNDCNYKTDNCCRPPIQSIEYVHTHRSVSLSLFTKGPSSTCGETFRDNRNQTLLANSALHSTLSLSFLCKEDMVIQQRKLLLFFQLLLMVVVTVDGKLLDPEKLQMFVDEVEDMPRIQGFHMNVNGVPRPKHLKIGMFNILWVRTSISA